MINQQNESGIDVFKKKLENISHAIREGILSASPFPLPFLFFPHVLRYQSDPSPSPFSYHTLPLTLTLHTLR